MADTYFVTNHWGIDPSKKLVDVSAIWMPIPQVKTFLII